MLCCAVLLRTQNVLRKNEWIGGWDGGRDHTVGRKELKLSQKEKISAKRRKLSQLRLRMDGIDKKYCCMVLLHQAEKTTFGIRYRKTRIQIQLRSFLRHPFEVRYSETVPNSSTVRYISTIPTQKIQLKSCRG